jgi:DNA-binding protein YbaB
MDDSALRARADELAAQFEQARATAGDVRQRLLDIRATAKSDDGYITVGVGHQGRVESIDIDPRIYRRPDSRQLAETLLETIKRAAADAQRQIDEVSKSFLGGGDLSAALNLDFDSIFRKVDEQLDELSRGGPQ